MSRGLLCEGEKLLTVVALTKSITVRRDQRWGKDNRQACDSTDDLHHCRTLRDSTNPTQQSNQAVARKQPRDALPSLLMMLRQINDKTAKQNLVLPKARGTNGTIVFKGEGSFKTHAWCCVTRNMLIFMAATVIWSSQFLRSSPINCGATCRKAVRLC